MIFRRTPQFKIDYRYDLDDSLQEETDKSFPDVVKAFMGDTELRRRFKFHPLKGRDEIFAGHIKHNLCFTYHIEHSKDGEKIIFFRRIGTHNIYKNP